MELSASQERVIKVIMAEISCHKDFECYTSKFEKLTPVRQLSGTNLIECQSVTGDKCPMRFAYGRKVRLCGCQLRKYVAVELDT